MSEVYESFSGTRLTLAMQLRGMTPRELAHRLGIKPQQLKKYLSDDPNEVIEEEPPREIVDKLVFILRMPRKFYFGEDIELFREGDIFFSTSPWWAGDDARADDALRKMFASDKETAND